MKPKGNRVLLLHPGEMGHAVGAALIAAGQSVSWVSEGRSEATRKRAESAGLTGIAELREGLAEADLVVSVCPPASAQNQAAAVASAGFGGAYLDANAIGPESVRHIASVLSGNGAKVIDGGIIGPPPTKAGATRLFVSGLGAGEVVQLFAGSNVEVIDAGEEVGAASAVKMAYAAGTKGMSALLISVRALARSEGVEELLLAEWARSQPALASRDLSSSIAKAWRFVGEMEEISKTYADNDLPAGFHQAAAQLYQSLSPCKDKWDVTLDEALALLVRSEH